ncbi:hypothetical protein, partial [Frankia sp. CIT1]|uniref:cupredoxin domain-containing protein n=1 Tax=Frankia sp. CIT1 TaxID=2880974 RepID=UPI001EF4BF96
APVETNHVITITSLTAVLDNAMPEEPGHLRRHPVGNFLLMFSPMGLEIPVNDSVTWVNNTDSPCALTAVADTLPPGQGANPIPGNGGRYTIVFSRDAVTRTAGPEYDYRCASAPASTGHISVH